MLPHQRYPSLYGTKAKLVGVWVHQILCLTRICATRSALAPSLCIPIIFYERVPRCLSSRRVGLQKCYNEKASSYSSYSLSVGIYPYSRYDNCNPLVPSLRYFNLCSVDLTIIDTSRAFTMQSRDTTPSAQRFPSPEDSTPHPLVLQHGNSPSGLHSDFSRLPSSDGQPDPHLSELPSDWIILMLLEIAPPRCLLFFLLNYRSGGLYYWVVSSFPSWRQYRVISRDTAFFFWRIYQPAGKHSIYGEPWNMWLSNSQTHTPTRRNVC